jgi:hypothetical protein
MKYFLILFLFFLTFNSYSQIVKEGEFVKLPLRDYRNIRCKLIVDDSLIYNYKKLTILQDQRIINKDSTIELFNKKNDSCLDLLKKKDNILQEKDLIIDSLDSQLYKSQVKCGRLEKVSIGLGVLTLLFGIIVFR